VPVPVPGALRSVHPTVLVPSVELPTPSTLLASSKVHVLGTASSTRRANGSRACCKVLATFDLVDLIEVEIDQNRMASFDGRVLEVFGGTYGRFHVKLLTATVSAPDKRGNRQVTLQQAQVNTPLPLDEAAFAKFQPLLDALRAAGVPVTS